MNKNIMMIEKKLDGSDWHKKLESEFYTKDIERYILESVELSVIQKLELVIAERKRILDHEQQNSISDYDNLILEIRIKQMDIYITQLKQIITIDKMKNGLLESESLINKII
ncbi:MAG: hypothetical protein KAQ94_06875 [Arcobacteraceae bacterium]|nr:hypothetical protein [Arcobacteraceae bacterium]